jgi:hypothetical protein
MGDIKCGLDTAILVDVGAVGIAMVGVDDIRHC